MRKKIALLANGWGSEFLQKVGDGIQRVAFQNDIDIFAFVNYTAYADIQINKMAEFNIFQLPKFEDFDGAIILAASFNAPEELEYVKKELERTKIPAISLEYELEGADFLGTDDYVGMAELVEHLIVVHGIKDFMFMGGMRKHNATLVRQKAVVDTLMEHGIVLPESNILYGNFAGAEAAKRLDEWCLVHDKLPQAIVCANDMMAEGLCDWAKEHGLNVPKDIVITGYDCIKRALEYEPTITTVNQEWTTLGVRCMEKLMQKIEQNSKSDCLLLESHRDVKKMMKTSIQSRETLPSVMVCGGSCGCKYDASVGAKIYNKTMRTRSLDGFKCDQHFRHMYLAIRKSQNTEDLYRSFNLFFSGSTWLEGNRIMICLHPDFFTSSDDLSSMRMPGYPEEMDVVCSRFDGIQDPMTRMKTKDTLVSMAKRSEKPDVYIFVPLQCDGAFVGYAMMTSGFGITQNDVLYLWTRHMNQYLEQVRSNATILKLTQKLEALSVIDRMTGHYNRNGCESIVYERIREWQSQNGRSVIMLADLDRLKFINDNLGHGYGDMAIKIVARALKNGLPENYLVGRLGGDEFFVAACENQPIELETIIKKVQEQLEIEQKTEAMPCKITVSVGAIQLNEGEMFDEKICIQKMDEHLYNMKKKHHAISCS